jgi:hypothetical protein
VVFFLFSSPPIATKKAIYEKDWRCIQYDKENPISVEEHDMYYACVRVVSGNGLCQYAICMQCYDKNKPKRDRGYQRETQCTSNSEKHKKCYHRVFDLEGTRDPRWFSKACLYTVYWKGQGCIRCEREFLK